LFICRQNTDSKVQMSHRRQNPTVAASKFLAKVLRHNPELGGVTLSPEGWAPIATLEEHTRTSRLPITRAIIDEIIRSSAKVRFEVSPDGEFIRALHGHSIDVELDYEAQPPPPVLYHGTSQSALPSIRTQGLLPMGRKFVHLTTDVKDAKEVGRRHGKLALLTVDSGRMAAEGAVFYTPGNKVWLVDKVEPKYISGLEGA
jgi:putative RNA 2'-phosphotransferase